MIQIYDPGNTGFDYNGDMTLIPSSCPLSIELNGAWELTLTHPLDDAGRWSYITRGAVIKAPSFNGDQLFRIYNTERTDDSVVANARPIAMDAGDEVFYLDTRPTQKNGQEALNILLSGTKYTGKSNIQKVATAYYVRKNFLEALNGDDDQAFLKRWGGEIVYNNYQIIVNDHAGEDNGVTVEYGKNLSAIDETVSTEDVVTRIVPLAYNGYMISGSSPWVDSPNINAYPKMYIRVVQFDDIKMAEDAQEDDEDNGITICQDQDELDAALRERAAAMYSDDHVDAPSVTMQVSMILLQNTEEYKDYKILETVGIGDTVHCKYKKFDIDTEARVVAMTWDCLTESVSEVTIGAKQDTYFDDLTSIYDKADNVFNQDGTINADWLNGTINALNVKFKALRDVAQKQDVRAILFEDLDPESPTYGAMCLGTMGFEIASERNATDTDWDWRTFGTGQGFTCDALIAGKIMGARFELDLDAGTVKFGQRNAQGVIDDPALYYGPDKFTIKFDNNFATTDDLKDYSTTEEMESEISAKIEASAAGITAQFNKTLQDNYSTTEQMNTAIQVSAEGINVNLQKNYYTAQQTQTIIDNKEETINDKIDSDIDAAEGKLIESYTAAINLSAQSLTTQFNQTLKGYSDTEAMNSAISQSAQNLTIQFNQTLNGYATNSAVQDMETEITQEYKAAIEASAQSLKSELSASITSAELGATNLIAGTSFYNVDMMFWQSSDGSKVTFQAMDNGATTSGKCCQIFIMKQGTGTAQYRGNRTKLEAGKTYTWSIMLFSPSAMNYTVGLQSSNGTKTVSVQTGWQTITHTFTPTVSDSRAQYFVIQPLSTVYEQQNIIIGDLKMIEGDEAGGWTPAPADVSDALSSVVTDEKMNSAILVQAQILEQEFNQKFGDYPTKIEMNGAIEQTAAGLTSQFTTTLSNYSNTMQMNSAIEQRADIIMSTVNTKVGKTEMSTQIQQNATAVRLAWNNYTKYVQFEQARLNIYTTGDNLLMSLDSDGMGLYRNDNNTYIGKIGTNNITDHPEWKGLDFDLEYAGEYMTWGAMQSADANTYQMVWSYARQQLGSLPAGLSATANINMRSYRIIDAYLVNSRILEGNTWYYNMKGSGITMLRYYQYSNATQQKYGYVEVSTTNYGAVGLTAWQSDGRLKKNITPATGNATDIIKSIPVRSFDWKESGAHEDYGLIAQELEKIDPRFIFKVAQCEDDKVLDEVYQIKESALVPILIKAVQELANRVENMETQKDGVKRMVAKTEIETPEQYPDSIVYAIPKDRETGGTYTEPKPPLYKRNTDGSITFLKEESEE